LCSNQVYNIQIAIVFTSTPHNKMKIPCGKLGLVLFIQLSAVSLINAQSKTATGTLLAPPQSIAIDGEIKEWGDSLRYFNTEKQLNYALANDKDNLYMAIKITERSEQIRVIKAGITFSIDPKGKKKETYSITFPANTQAETVVKPQINDLGPVTEAQRSELEQQKLTTLRGIKVEGFKDIEGDMITTSNTYGIKTALNYDDAGNLVCEAAIPLSFFHDDNPTKNEWAFNFKINGIKKSAPKSVDGDPGSQSGGKGGRGGGSGGFGGGGGGGRGGHGGKGGGNKSSLDDSDPNNLSKSEDFWEKYYLAK
jgi:YD repeat-containing protein